MIDDEIIIGKLHITQFADVLKPRVRDGHKGLYGHVLVIGGDYGYSGAVRMAAEAALRVGAGLVSVVTRSEHALSLNVMRPEIMCHGYHSAKDLQALMSKATVIVVGPGIGQSRWSTTLFKWALKTKKPLIVDADALNLLAKKPKKRSNWILTPHPGEAARLLKAKAATIQNNRLFAIDKLQQRYGGVCVLKGAGTLVMGPDEHPMICEAGNPGMATAGMGDILSGIIGGFAAQDMPILTAAKLGVLVHATAGDLAAKEGGERGMIATDLLPYLRRLVNFK